LKRRAIIFVAVLALAALVGYRLLNPPPPNLSADGYVSAKFDFRELPDLPAFQAETSDPQVVQALTKVLASGRGDVDCRCIATATVTLKRPDGKQFAFQLKPAHGDNDCQVRIDGHRYSVDRKSFLAAIAPLGIPVERVTGP
jgi:hypothetical protein